MLPRPLIFRYANKCFFDHPSQTANHFFCPAQFPFVYLDWSTPISLLAFIITNQATSCLTHHHRLTHSPFLIVKFHISNYGLGPRAPNFVACNCHFQYKSFYFVCLLYILLWCMLLLRLLLFLLYLWLLLFLLLVYFEFRSVGVSVCCCIFRFVRFFSFLYV